MRERRIGVGRVGVLCPVQHCEHHGGLNCEQTDCTDIWCTPGPSQSESGTVNSCNIIQQIWSSTCWDISNNRRMTVPSSPPLVNINIFRGSLGRAKLSPVESTVNQGTGSQGNCSKVGFSNKIGSRVGLCRVCTGLNNSKQYNNKIIPS